MLDSSSHRGRRSDRASPRQRAALRARPAPPVHAGGGRPARAAHLGSWSSRRPSSPAFETLAIAYQEAERLGKHRDARRAVRALLREGPSDAAVALARAELARTRETFHEAGAAYLLGLALEAARASGALEAYDRAARLADDQPRLRERARVRGLRVCGSTDEAARRAADLLPLADASPTDRLAVAVAALASPGRYRRATALDVLEELARKGGDLGRHARARAAAHAESAPLSTIEADRVRAVLGHGASDEELATFDTLVRLAGGDAGVARGEEAIRARAVLDGCAPGPRPAEGRLLVEWLALAIVHAVRSRRVHEARELLREAHYRIAEGARVEAPLWTAVHAAMGLAPEPARALTRALLARTSGEPPPRGYLSLADAWLAAGADEEGIALLRRAARLREPGARQRLAAYLRHQGWVAAAEGRREDAIERLREAKHLAR
ncbi:MAG: hypothetical protein R3B82_24410 [Sandaracinaceae bacterium]